VPDSQLLCLSTPVAQEPVDDAREEGSGVSRDPIDPDVSQFPTDDGWPSCSGWVDSTAGEGHDDNMTQKDSQSNVDGPLTPGLLGLIGDQGHQGQEGSEDDLQQDDPEGVHIVWRGHHPTAPRVIVHHCLSNECSQDGASNLSPSVAQTSDEGDSAHEEEGEGDDVVHVATRDVIEGVD